MAMSRAFSLLDSIRVEMPDDTHPLWMSCPPGRLALARGCATADFEASNLSPAGVLLLQSRIVSDIGQII